MSKTPKTIDPSLGTEPNWRITAAMQRERPRVGPSILPNRKKMIKDTIKLDKKIEIEMMNLNYSDLRKAYMRALQMDLRRFVRYIDDGPDRPPEDSE